MLKRETMMQLACNSTRGPLFVAFRRQRIGWDVCMYLYGVDVCMFVGGANTWGPPGRGEERGVSWVQETMHVYQGEPSP